MGFPHEQWPQNPWLVCKESPFLDYCNPQYIGWVVFDPLYIIHQQGFRSHCSHKSALFSWFQLVTHWDDPAAIPWEDLVISQQLSCMCYQCGFAVNETPGCWNNERQEVKEVSVWRNQMIQISENLWDHLRSWDGRNVWREDLLEDLNLDERQDDLPKMP